MNFNPQQDHQRYYRALAARDARFDGVFFTGVKTTGIYCRPVCPAKTPHAASCEFFTSAAAAEAAGFRPCLRCRPELAPYPVQQNLAHALWRRIAAGALNEGSLEQLAHEAGLSARQLRRVLVQEFGVTPIELAQTQRLLFAKKLLQETRLNMTAVAFAAGFGSVRRFNALFAQRYQIAPATIRRSGSAPGDGIVLRLAYRPPYDWDALLAYLAARAMPGLEAVTRHDGAYQRSVRIGAHSGWIRVAHAAEQRQLVLDVAPALVPVLLPLLDQLRRQFDLEANPLVIAQQLQESPVLAAAVARHPGLRVPGAFDVFELALRAVLGQQVSVAGATTLAGRLVQRFGDVAATPFADVTRHFPTPAALAAAPLAELRALGLPATRAATVQHLARFALAGGLHVAPGAALEPTVAHLKTVPGIGAWTAHYIAMRALRFPDAFPAGDLGLQKAAARLLQTAAARLPEKQLGELAQAWSPWRAYAALHLWFSLGENDGNTDV